MGFFDKIIDFFKSLQTEQVVGYLQQAEIGKLIHHPYFLAVAGTLAIVCLIMKWRTLLTFEIVVVGFAELLNYTFAKGTDLDKGMGSDSLLIFVGFGVVIVALAIYLLFIKSE